MKLNLGSFILSMLATTCVAKVGELCHDNSGNYGTCQTTSWCRTHNGHLSTSTQGLCPDDSPQKTECCFKPECLPEHDGWYCDYVGGRDSCAEGVWGA
ncbi:hypothetical protein ONS96_014819 [Cadophora gregata f. sp. sojae]|nr:hypothetical protein ONS96_014819 [Cadophora gregata f. sp. sojae]